MSSLDDEQSRGIIKFISPVVITESHHPCRFQFHHHSPPSLFARSRAQLIDLRTLIIFASARCPHRPLVVRSAWDHFAHQSRCTHSKAQ
jgi:hypothetical protein